MKGPVRVPPYARAVLASAAALGLAWVLFYFWRDPAFLLTPYKGQAPLAPLYAFFRQAHTAWLYAALVLAAAAAGGLAAARRLGGGAGREAIFLAGALLFAIAFRFAVHAIPAPVLPGREMMLYPGEDILTDADHIVSPAGFLRDYTRIQPRLSLHGRTHPPGFALLHYAIRTTLGDDLETIGSALTALAGLVVIPGYFLGRILRGRAEDGRAAALLLAVLPAPVLYGAVTLDAVFAVAAAAVVVAVVAEARRPDWRTRAALGLGLFIAMMLSYSAFVLGLLSALLLVLAGWRRPSDCALRLAQVLAAFLLPFAVLFLAYGFDGWACFANARAINTTLMTSVIGRPLHSWAVWIYSAPGNLLAFLLGLGPAIVGGWLLLRPARLEPEVRRLGAALVATLLVACGGGLYFMETERIFLFLAPPAVAVALAAPGFRPAAAVALSGLQAIAMEATLNTLW